MTRWCGPGRHEYRHLAQRLSLLPPMPTLLPPPPLPPLCRSPPQRRLPRPLLRGDEAGMLLDLLRESGRRHPPAPADSSALCRGWTPHMRTVPSSLAVIKAVNAVSVAVVGGVPVVAADAMRHPPGPGIPLPSAPLSVSPSSSSCSRPPAPLSMNSMWLIGPVWPRHEIDWHRVALPRVRWPRRPPSHELVPESE